MRPAGLFFEQRKQRVGECDLREEVGLEDLVQQVGWNLDGGVLGAGAGEDARRDSGVVDQDVEAAVVRIEVVVGGLVVGWIRDVEVEEVGVNTRRAKLCDCLFALRRGRGSR